MLRQPSALPMRTRIQSASAFLATTLLVATPLMAAIVVNDPLPIVETVDVRLIQTASTDGSVVANGLGNSTQRAAIEAAIDKIWSQAGIDVNFEPGMIQFRDTFALQGLGGVRPEGDLNTIMQLARSKGVLSPDPKTLNLFLVDVAPGYGPTGDLYINSMAQLGGNGIAAFIGDFLFMPLISDGTDLVATDLAQKIGHNLGLRPIVGNGQNLMSIAAGGSQQLTPLQVFSAWESELFATPTPGMEGDFNRDGSVDSADYTTWRDGLGTDYDQTDYNVWRSNFGSTAAAGESSGDESVIPEPTAFLLLILCIAGFTIARNSQAHSQS